MTFPQTRLDEIVELDIDGTWTDISSYVLQRDVPTITRGRDEGAAYVDTGSVQYTLRNDDYRFSPRHPESPYYGVLGRNTPLRASVDLGTPFLGIPGVSGVHAEANDSAALSITGDIEIVADVSLDDWGYGGHVGVAGKPLSWALWQWGGYVWFRWYTSAVAYLQAQATVLTPIPLSKRLALKVTLDVNNGAGGNTVTFYTAPTASDTWTQLGDPVVTAGTTSIYNSTEKVYLGQEGASASGLTPGRMYAFQCRNGIGGSLVADVDFTAQTVGASSFVDDAGVTWTMVGSPGITNRRVRFQGEVAAWPVKSDVSGADRYVTVEANGVMRRLGRCTSTLPSCLARDYLSVAAGVHAYWPCEDLSGSKSVASGMANAGYPMSVSGTPDFGGYTDFLASRPLPLMRNASFTGRVKPYTATSYHQFRFFVAIPSGGSTGGGVLMKWRTTGDAAYWELRYGTGAGVGFDPGRVRLLAYDDMGTAIFDTGATYYDMELDGKLVFIHIEINPSADSWDVILARYEVGGISPGYYWTFEHTISDLGRVTSVTACPDNNHDEVMIGHISVQAEITSIYDAQDLMNGYEGETSANRIRRLCGEAGITFEPRGDMEDCEKCGVQTPDSILNLLRETAETDGGILFESRDRLGLAYATRRSLYSQVPSIALNVETDHHLSAPLDPIDDDSMVVNDVTVVRKNGSSARVQVETGALSLLDPPDGVGSYEQSQTLCLAYDERCKPMAEWLTALGTVDLARYPTVTLNLARDIIAGNSALLTSLLDLEQGMLISLSDLPPDQAPDTVYLMMVGNRETLEAFSYEMKLSCVAEGPMYVGMYDDDDSRYDSAASNLAANITTTGTSLAVLVDDVLWTTDAGDMPFDIVIGGEQMRVTNITGAASPQTFTVTRSINGVVKAHLATAPLQLYRPVYYGA